MDRNKVEAATENLEYVAGVLDRLVPDQFLTNEDWEAFAGACLRIRLILKQLREVIQ